MACESADKFIITNVFRRLENWQRRKFRELVKHLETRNKRQKRDSASAVNGKSKHKIKPNKSNHRIDRSEVDSAPCLYFCEIPYNESSFDLWQCKRCKNGFATPENKKLSSTVAVAS